MRLRRGGARLGLLGLLVGSVMLTLLVGSASAAALQVTTTDDTVAVDGNCSLREAIQAANTDTAVNECQAGSGADTITFAVTGTITLTSELLVSSDLTIQGPGAANLTVSGNNASRVISHTEFFSVLAIDGLTVADGRASGELGGGINSVGRLIVTNSAFLRNSARGGGAIHNEFGGLSVTDSTFSGNTAGEGGGAISIFPATLTSEIANSTFVGNTTVGGGGAISNANKVIVTNSTFSGNSATTGGGIHNEGTLTFQNNIVASSPSGGNCSGSVPDGGGNLSWPDTTCPGINADPLLGSLQPNGGPTDTMALQTGSAALNVAVLANCPSTDQRGITRPQGTGCDIGAFEFVPPPPPSIGAFTLGYWKNHLANSNPQGPFFSSECATVAKKGGSCSTSGPWAIQYLPKTLGNYQVDTITKAAQVFKAANCSSSKPNAAIGCLAGQLLATKLNLANGSLACPSILQAVADADAFLKGQTVNGVPGINYVGPSGSYTLTAAQRNLAIALKTKLDAYNNNISCP